MQAEWDLPPIPGYITFECASLEAALEAFTKAENEAEEAGYFISTAWRGSQGEADMTFWRTDEERRFVNEALSARDWPRPVAALRWVWPMPESDKH